MPSLLNNFSLSLFLLTLFTSALIMSSNNAFAEYYIEADVMIYSEPVTVHGALNEWTGAFFGGTVAVTHDAFETGWTQERFQIGLIRRYDYELEFSADTAEITYKLKNDIPLDINRVYQLDLLVRHTYSQGARLRLTKKFNPRLNVTYGLSFLQGLKLTEGRIYGTATTTTDSEYDIEFYIDYYYSEDHIFKRNVNSPKGYGISTDIKLEYQATQNYRLNLDIIDLLGRMIWLKTPRTTEQLASNNGTIDSDGWFVSPPKRKGRNSEPDYVQKLRPKIALTNRYTLTNTIELFAGIYRTSAITLFDVGAVYSISDNSVLHLSYMPALRAITLGTETKHGYFSITSNRTEFQKSNILAAKFGIKIPF